MLIGVLIIEAVKPLGLPFSFAVFGGATSSANVIYRFEVCGAVSSSTYLSDVWTSLFIPNEGFEPVTSSTVSFPRWGLATDATDSASESTTTGGGTKS